MQQLNDDLDSQFWDLMNDPRLNVEHPMLKAQLAMQTQNSLDRDEAHGTLLDAIKTGETPGVLRSLERQVAYHDELVNASIKRCMNTARRLLREVQ